MTSVWSMQVPSRYAMVYSGRYGNHSCMNRNTAMISPNIPSALYFIALPFPPLSRSIDESAKAEIRSSSSICPTSIT